MNLLKQVFFFGLSLTLTTGVSATTLSGTFTADDAFNAYLSTSDSVQGTDVAYGASASIPGAFTSFSLTSGTTYYVHVAARDLYGDRSGFLGSLSLSGAGFAFSNGAQVLGTNTTDWKVSLTGFGANYVAPYSMGLNGVSPWGPINTIAPTAEWIWTGDVGERGVIRYFSTTITPTSIAAVPAPETFALLMAGLGGLRLVTRRRKQKPLSD